MGEERCRGTVMRFDDQKGFGFIKPEDGGDDLFVHHSAIKSEGFRSLQQGQVVEFYVAIERDRTKAVDVSALIQRPHRDTRGAAVRGCYTCGAHGHMARDCPTAAGGFDRRGGSGGAGGGGCFNCGLPGHIARECNQGGGRSGGYGGGGGGGGGCFNCGLPDHIVRECNQGGGRSGGYGGGGGCYSCGGQGHMARDCPSGGNGGGSYGGRFGGGGRRSGGGGGNCYKCGETGHFARECINTA